MTKIFYHIYCNGILGLKINVPGFKWVYGSAAPNASAEAYEKCIVKFDVSVKPEKKLGDVKACDKRFQAYTWSAEDKNIYCRRTFLRGFRIGYNIRICGNTVFAEVGEHYYKMVRNRIMNLHGMYYLLSDLANVMLLKNGLLTLYASAIHFEPDNKCVINFAPPNTGKTLTATKLCQQPGYKLVGEDIVISDGQKVFACPWTNSYRGKGASCDDAGSLGRVSRAADNTFCEECEVTDLTVLALGPREISGDKEKILRQICVLNGYLFNYYSSPIIKILAFFNDEYCEAWNDCAERILRNMVEANECHYFKSEMPVDFSGLISFGNSGKG